MWKMLSIKLKASLCGLLQVKCVICYNVDDYITILGMLVTNIIDNQKCFTSMQSLQGRQAAQ